MKTKFLALTLSLCLVLCAFCSCGTGNTTETAATTKQQYCNGLPADIVISGDNIADLLNEIKTSNKEVADVMKNQGILYYPVPKESGYELIYASAALSADGEECCVEYYFENKSDDFSYDQYLMIDLYYFGDSLEVRVEKLKEDPDSYITMDDGSVKPTGNDYLYFRFGGKFHLMQIGPDYTDDLIWQNIFEIKSVDITK